MSNTNLVWVKQSAIDAVKKPKQVRRQSLSFSQSSHSLSQHSSDSESVSSHGRAHVWEWQPAHLIENNEHIVVQLLDDTIDPVVTLPKNSIKESNVVLSNDFEKNEQGQPLPPNDLITLTHLHEPAVVESLKYRYEQDKIYTNTGPVLLALNPFQNIRGMYGESVMKKYWERSEKNLKIDLPPHVYNIAEVSFRSMMRGLEDSFGEPNGSSSGCNQSILVSGESGAGKTVTTKFVMKYLAALSQRSAAAAKSEKRAYQKAKERSMCPSSPTRHSPTKKTFDQPSWAVSKLKATSNRPKIGKSASDISNVASLDGGAKDSIEAQVLQSNPILESFGNARTVRNDNSSRFGKFIEIQFTRNGRLVGAQIETYLLEKVRLISQQAGERNYHIFYEIMSGVMDKNELANLYLAPTARPNHFKMTASGTYNRRDGVSDQETFKTLRSAMQTMKFSNDEVEDIFGVTAAMLHASNLNFNELPHESSELDGNNVHLEPVCELLGVTQEELSQALCSITIQAGRESSVQRSLNVQRAQKCLEAFIKATYGALFSHLVERINDLVAFKNPADDSSQDSNTGGRTPRSKPAASIAVLDIFGFESFTVNSFEQLCINYCNEALQQQFNAFVLKNEQKEYEREGIEWSFIEFPENQDVLDLIEKRGTGILSLLDDQCRAPGPSDKAFVLSVYQTCKEFARFSANRQQTAVNAFSVHHYAGKVEYSTEGFVEKNRDELSKEATMMLKNSRNEFVQDLAYILEKGHETVNDMSKGPATPAKFYRSDSAVGRATLGGQFRRQLRNLRHKIDQTAPHYIRCLKPNDHLVPDQFDSAIVAEQLKCGGILEAVRVARAGYTQHYLHSDFVRRYRALAWQELGTKAKAKTYTPKVTQNIRRAASLRGFNVTPIETDHEELEQSYSKKVHTTDDCKEIVKIIYHKLLEEEKKDGEEEENMSEEKRESSPPATAKKWKPPSLQDYSRPVDYSRPMVASSAKARQTPQKPASSPQPSQSTRKRGGHTTTDYAKAGIQMGKTKVFLRHHAFETLERIRGQEQTRAATLLNSVFRRFLARIAYLPYRNAFRHELHNFMSDQQEEEDYSRFSERFYNAALAFHRGGNFACHSMVDKWMESRIRDAIHNPTPRHEWGRQGPSGDFKWVLDEGIWIRNYDFEERE